MLQTTRRVAQSRRGRQAVPLPCRAAPCSLSLHGPAGRWAVRLATEAQCREYVEAELAHLLRSRPTWHVDRTVNVPLRPLTWNVGCDEEALRGSWYTLEANMAGAEFLVWFGNHQASAESIFWIMRPAVHIAFQDLTPQGDRAADLNVRLSEVLALMIRSLGRPVPGLMRYEPNTYSPT